MDLKRRSKISAEFSMSSMTDIVFLLLIFFMLASTLVTSSALDLTLPSSAAKVIQRKDVVVHVSSDERFSVESEIVSEAELEMAILRKVTDPKEAVIMLRADKSVSYEKIVLVMDIAYRNKLKMVAATDPK
tara:strand:- start:930 stop:1322 length:393 start_codon:yes stop_codon:yes gene_type:complete